MVGLDDLHLEFHRVQQSMKPIESLQYSAGQCLEIPLTSHDFWVIHNSGTDYRMLWGYTTSIIFQATPKWATLLLMKLVYNRWHLAEWSETLKVVWEARRPEGPKRTLNQSTVHRLTHRPHHHTMCLSKPQLEPCTERTIGPFLPCAVQPDWLHGWGTALGFGTFFTGSLWFEQ